MGHPLAAIDAHAHLDLAVDGADEVDPGLELIKGLGGALLREKAVELRARRLVVIVDETKLVPRLGTKAPLPVEVDRQGWAQVAERLQAELGCIPAIRGGPDQPFATDNSNYILDCRFANGIADPRAVASRLDRDPQVRAHGLFLGMASQVIVAGADGTIRKLERER